VKSLSSGKKENDRIERTRKYLLKGGKKKSGIGGKISVLTVRRLELRY